MLELVIETDQFIFWKWFSVSISDYVHGLSYYDSSISFRVEYYGQSDEKTFPGCEILMEEWEDDGIFPIIKETYTLGCIEVRDIGKGRIHVIGTISPDYEQKFKPIFQKIAAVWTKANPDLPIRPSNGSSKEDWFRYKYECDQSKSIKFSHKDLASELHLSYGYVRSLYGNWKKGIGS